MPDRRPMSEAPTDGTPILVEHMNVWGVPETGGHSFILVRHNKKAIGGWFPADQKDGDMVTVHYSSGGFLGWWPADTDPATLTLTPRTNWKFRPGNGTEGDMVYSSWCEKCIRERPIREHYDYAVANGLGCNIFARTMAFDIKDADYPEEWTLYPDGKPKCTAFERDTGQPTQEPRCKQTIEMFPTEDACLSPPPK